MKIKVIEEALLEPVTFDVEELERKVLDIYCVDGGIRPNILVTDSTDVEVKLEIRFIRYTRPNSTLSGHDVVGEKDVRGYIWMNVDQESHNISDMGTDLTNPDNDDIKMDVDDRYSALVYKVYERMLDDVENETFTIE